MKIRTARSADIPAMMRIRLSVTENRLTRTVITEKDYVNAITRSGKGWVSEIDGVIRGFAVGNLERANVWALFVEPGYEGSGIGRRLHDEMMAWFRDNDCSSVWLETEGGTRAERFYRRAGWRQVGTTPEGDIRFQRDETTEQL